MDTLNGIFYEKVRITLSDEEPSEPFGRKVFVIFWSLSSSLITSTESRVGTPLIIPLNEIEEQPAFEWSVFKGGDVEQDVLLHLINRIEK